MTERFKYIIKILSLAAFIVLLVMPPLSWFLYKSYLSTPLLNETTVRFNVPSQSNLVMVASELSQMGYLQYPKLLVLHAKLEESTLVQAGEYYFKPGMTPEQLLVKLNSGEVINYSTTLPEGFSFKQIRQRLENNPNLIPDTQGKNEAELIEYLGIDIERLEGWFYPDTYVYSSNTKVSTILKQAHQKMRAELDTAWAARDTGLPFDRPYEALILASIVEKETGVGYERPEIAGVFMRRLQIGMRLQTDPTVIYAMGDSYVGNIRRSDLAIDSPYNTYKNHGLPPTPIAAAGKAALEAVMHPTEGTTLYFVGKGDGSHYFSTTLEEHNKAVREFQIENRSSNYRSTPK